MFRAVIEPGPELQHVRSVPTLAAKTKLLLASHTIGRAALGSYACCKIHKKYELTGRTIVD